jgi:drug/metabolite transporter (DMT)-like permease
MITALVLVSAFLHAAWNALLKREPDKDRTLIAAVAFGAVLAAVVAVGRALVTGVPAFAMPAAFGWALVAGAFEQIYFYGLARALDRGPLGPVYTISRGGAVLIVYPLSVWLFDEPLTAFSMSGSALVLVGLVLSDLRIGAGTLRAMPVAATAWAITCAVAIAAYHVAYKAALEDGGGPSSVFAVSLAFSTAISLLRTGRTGRAAVVGFIRANLPKVTLMGALCGGSFLILIEALAHGGAGFVLTLRNTSVLFAMLLAWSIGERPRLAPALGAALVASGAVLMTF